MIGSKQLAKVFERANADETAKQKNTGLFYQGMDGKFVPVEAPESPKATVVPSDDKDEKKSTPAVLGAPMISLATAKMMLHQRNVFRGKKAGKFGSKHIPTTRVVLAARFNGTGSSASPYAPVVSLGPNSTGVTEAVAFAGLYDEARCTKVVFKCRQTTPGSPANTSGWGMAFDPSNNGAYGSLVGITVTTQYVAPIAYNNPADTAVLVQNNTGYFKMVGKPLKVLPTAGAGGAGAGEIVGSDWFATSDTSACVGYWKAYFEPIASTMVTYDLFVQYHMEYRNRT